MISTMTRRDFLLTSAAVGAGLAVSAPPLAAAPFKTTLRKALIRGLPDAKTLADLKAAGFHGLECNAYKASLAEAAGARRRAEAQGLTIHAVLRGWCNFNSPDAKVVQADLESVRHALRLTQALGGEALLLVPCKVGGTVPDPWTFRYDYDPQSLQVRRVVEGDNTRFTDYIAAQNLATESSRQAVQSLIPEAERCGVVIALENVWNNLWVMPDFFAAFVTSFQSPWVKAYLDLGNHVKYAPTPAWIEALGTHIARCHVKDFRLRPDGHGGEFCDPRDGSNDWLAVRTALDRVGYEGWLTIEGSGAMPLAEQSRRLDLIIRGQ